ncbi:GntR family transcriptional regulator [uncultured Anaerococcus sp.]|uniref:GntR family transcriptional regulator n=1 Tax=uncultured Anaerococcus sp. TaxID=293428 RepID=UPI0025F6E92C|nr:GntR family transcriptional regulator [uncultured Anaerococcus sp.]
MVYKNKQSEIKDFVALELISGRKKYGDPFFEKKFFTSKFKVNPSYVKDVLDDLEKEGIIQKQGESYIFSADENRVFWLKDEFLHSYINDFTENLNKIGVSMDEVIEILRQRNIANG